MNLEAIMVSHLYEVPRVVKFVETENKNGGCQGLRERRNGGLLFNWYRVIGLQDEKNSGDKQ